ncbi:alpha,alpha-trehalase [Candidatus Saccharibacteria bacterium]|nr:alpha,alpha-trehalase [Candidatus Saccharibacteria bacterium]
MSRNINLSFTPEQTGPALVYIERYWHKLIAFSPHDQGTLIGVPRPYLVPSVGSESFKFEEIFYWDSYFMAQGLLGTPLESMYRGIVEDLMSLMGRYGIIPNAGRTYMTGRSQPPFMTSMIMQVYELEHSKRWLERAMDVAKEEYRSVWMGTVQPNWRQVFHGLSRYYDVNVLNDLAECESGWDMTTRFHRQALSYIPVDLNALLWRYERDFAAAALILGDKEESQEWQHRAVKRRAAMKQFLWDEELGCWFDYNFMTGTKSSVWSLAAFYPMWVGMMSDTDAGRLMQHLPKFEGEGGLATTAKEPLVVMDMPAQWAYPNGWAPLQLLATEGMERYGYHTEAERVARKWLRNNLQGFETSGEFYEKYNVIAVGDEPVEGVYPSQTGFGWTNGVFTRLAERYLTAEELPPRMAAASDKTWLASLRSKQHQLARVTDQLRQRLA